MGTSSNYHISFTFLYLWCYRVSYWAWYLIHSERCQNPHGRICISWFLYIKVSILYLNAMCFFTNKHSDSLPLNFRCWRHALLLCHKNDQISWKVHLAESIHRNYCWSFLMVGEYFLKEKRLVLFSSNTHFWIAISRFDYQLQCS